MKKLLTIAVLALSTWGALQIGDALPLLGNSISAILIGAIIRHTPLYEMLDKTITKFVSSYLLKAGIVLLGFTLSLRIVGDVGATVLIILAAVVFVSLTVSFIANKFLGISSTTATLIGIGTSICGGSAIVATAPIMEADEKDIAVSITTMLIYSMMALFLLPLVGTLLGFSDQMYGILAGSAVNDTASVVATSFEWSDTAGAIATITKLTRTLFLVPVTLGVIFMKFRNEATVNKSAGVTQKIDFKQIIRLIPLFVVFFVLAVITATVVAIPANILGVISSVSKLLMTLALVTIGLGVHIKEIAQAGIKPVILGGLCWTGVVGISVVLINVFYGA